MVATLKTTATMTAGHDGDEEGEAIKASEEGISFLSTAIKLISHTSNTFRDPRALKMIQSAISTAVAENNKPTNSRLLGPNKYNGLDLEDYIWTQTLETVTIIPLKLPQGDMLDSMVQGDMPDGVVHSLQEGVHLTVVLQGQPPVFVGELYASVTDNVGCLATGNAKAINIMLNKSQHGWWKCLVKGDPAIDPRKAIEKLMREHEIASGCATPMSEEELYSLRGKNALLEVELIKSRKKTKEYQRHVCQLEKELKDLKEEDEKAKAKRLQVLSELLVSLSKTERQEARAKVRQESLRLGNIDVIRVGTSISEKWEDGQRLKDINARLKSLSETRAEIVSHMQSLKKRQSDKSDGNDVISGISEEEFHIQNEICKARLANIRREEKNCRIEKDHYEHEKAKLIREMKRIRDEDASRFNNFEILKERYALLNLLGKGGFSEVYKAYDLLEYRYVACKLHALDANWSDAVKQSYMSHAIRESNIQKELVHPHIVRLWDIFDIDDKTFCTILEYCSGKDLDAVLKATPILQEREARIIIVQIFRGLLYLNKRSKKIIHYDLKPANVLFDEIGVAKLTDFGLSKIVEDDVGSQGMELTSQGAGTYWYLPPECFFSNKVPLISSKVDVWSAGVMLYQMLYGRRPFGHHQSQRRILREETIINARKVEFPSEPFVSSEAKGFICRCLTYNQIERPDVLTIAHDPYLTYAKGVAGGVQRQ